MAYEDKPGDGVLFKNDKRTSDKQPEYKGFYFNEDMEKCDVAAWVRESSKTGQKFFSLKIALAPWKPDNAGEESQDGGGQSFYDKPKEEPQSDDVPF